MSRCNDPNTAPTVERLSQIFSGSAVKGWQPFSLSLCNICKMPPFQILLHPWVQKKVARSKVWQTGAVGHNHHFVFSQKLLDAQGCVGSGIFMVQEPIPTVPLFWMLLLQALTQSFQHIQVKLLIYCVSWMNKLPLNYPTTIKKRSQRCLDTLANLLPFFWSGQIW